MLRMVGTEPQAACHIGDRGPREPGRCASLDRKMTAAPSRSGTNSLSETLVAKARLTLNSFGLDCLLYQAGLSDSFASDSAAPNRCRSANQFQMKSLPAAQ
jgi:hypothetical protein